jgi:hypothetical protein
VADFHCANNVWDLLISRFCQLFRLKMALFLFVKETRFVSLLPGVLNLAEERQHAATFFPVEIESSSFDGLS